jgi:large subunit ribosomal protein L54
LVPKVPIYEQTIDLPAGDGTANGAAKAQSAREELTKAMRTKRRATIKEANFLRAMG